MNNQNVELDQLFAIAREQAPETSFEDTKKHFMGSLVLAAGGVLATKGIIQLFTKKWIIMLSIVTVATTATIVASTFNFGANQDQEPPVVSHPIPVEIQDEEAPVEPPMDETVPTIPEVEETEVAEASDVVTPPCKEVGAPVVHENVDYEPLMMVDEQRIWRENLRDGLSCKDMGLAPPDSLEKEKDDTRIIPYAERYVVTQNTTEEELQEIQRQAEDAGIKYSYHAHYAKGKLEELTISMSLKYKKGDRNSNMSETRTITDISKKDKIIIAWVEDPDGNAMIIGDEKDWDCDFDMGDMEEFEEYMKEFEKCMEEFELSMQEFDNMNFAFACDSGIYVINMDCGHWANDFDIVIPVAPEIPELEIQMELDELENQLEELDEINEEMLEEIEEKIEVLEEKLEELEERLEERKRELREKRERERE